MKYLEVNQDGVKIKIGFYDDVVLKDGDTIGVEIVEHERPLNPHHWDEDEIKPEYLIKFEEKK